MDATIPKEDKADVLANVEAPLSMEANRADLDDPRGYGNFFDDVLNWIARLVKK